MWGGGHRSFSGRWMDLAVHPEKGVPKRVQETDHGYIFLWQVWGG